MGVEPSLASSLIGVLAQRLVRTLRPASRDEHRAPEPAGEAAFAPRPSSDFSHEHRHCTHSQVTRVKQNGLSQPAQACYQLLVADDAIGRR